MKKLVLTICVSLAVLAPVPAFAQVNVFPQCGTQVDSAVCRGGGNLFGAGSIWNTILNVITYAAGAAAVLMIIIGGLRYILSNGNQSDIAAAKNTILYAVIGLILAMAGNAIVNFVLTNI